MLLPPTSTAPSGSQVREEPSVYLDICAYRRIANDPTLATRFERALQEKGGTLALNYHVFAEFASPNNEADAPKVADLIDRVFPRLYFQEWHHEKVIWAELHAGANADGSEDADKVLFSAETQKVWTGEEGSPPGDLMRALSGESAKRDLLRHMLRQRIPAELPKFDEMADRAAAHPDLRGHMAKLVAAAAATGARATRCLRHTVMYRYLMNRDRPRTPNDVYDIGHSIVSTAYCQFVVLDRYWSAITNEACHEIRKAGSKAPLARVFPVGSIEEFLSALEQCQSDQQ